MRLAGKIEDQISTGKIVNPYTLRSLLSIFLGKLKVHLDMEQTCFAQHLKSTDKNTPEVNHKKEMENFNAEVKHYSKKWSAPSTIGEEQQNFIEDTRDIIVKLNRIVKSKDHGISTLISVGI